MNTRSMTANGWMCLALLVLALAAAPARAEDAGYYIQNAKELIRKGDMPGAEIELRNAARKDPANGEVRMLMAQVYLALGAPNLADAELTLASKAGVPEARTAPLRAAILYNLGRVGDILKLIPDGNRPSTAESTVRAYRGLSYLSVDERDNARAEFNSAIKLDPKLPAPRTGMARLLLLEQKQQDAEAMVDAVLKVAPHNSDALDLKGVIQMMQGNLDGDIKTLSASIAADPNNFHALIDRASAYIARNKLDLAAKDVDAVLEAAPDSGTANYLYALIKTQRGKFDEADVVLEKLRPVMDQMPEAYFLAAVVKYNLEQLEQAEAFARRFIAQRPDNARAYELLGSIALRRGDASLAVERLQLAVKLAPNDPNAIGLLSEAEMAHGDIDNALVLLDRALKDRPEDVRLHTERAMGHLALGEEGQSIAELTEVFQAGKGNPLAGPPLILAALHAGKLDIASKSAETLVAEDPTNLFNQQLLGVVRMAQNNYPAAENIFRTLLAKSPNLTAARKDLAVIYLSTKRTAAAENLFKDRLISDPSDFSSAEALASIYAHAKDDGDAVAVLRQSQVVMGDNPAPSLALLRLYEQQKNWPALTKLAASIGTQFSYTEAVYDAIGIAYIAAGDLKTALATYKRATDSFPNSGFMWERYGVTQAAAKDYLGAIDSLSKAVALSPGNDTYKGELVSLTFEAKGGDAALSTANSLGNGNPDDPVAALLAADVLDKQGKRDAALALLQKAQAAHPTVAILLRICGLYQDSGDLKKAIALSSDWLKTHSDFVVRLMLAEFYGSSADYDDAQKQFEQLTAERPSDSVILNNLAWLYSRKGDPRALKLAQQAYAQNPDSPEIADTLGWILTGQNKANDGLKYLQSAVAANAADPSVEFHFAVALDRTGHHDEARLVLQKILKGNTKFAERSPAQALLDQIDSTQAKH